MGVVVAAHHVQLDTKVAIKFLLPEMLRNREAVERFLREARAAVRITSEHVARVYDVGALENGAPYMVMEFLEGSDLSALLKQRGPLPIEQAVDFVLQASVAIAEAHGLGIVHRDLKPANLFCVRRPDGQFLIKVLDFGISKREGGQGNSPADMFVTKTAAIIGSPLYMSPEQMQSAKSADAQSDLWALGVILYELLAGHPPFGGEAITEIVVQVTTQPPPWLRSVRPDVPPGLEAVVLRCLEKDRQRRLRNVAELALALVEFAPPRARAVVERIAGTIQAAGLSAGPVGLPAPSPMPATLVVPQGNAGAATAMPVSTSNLSIPRTSPWKGAIVAVGLLAAVALGGVGVLVARGMSHREDAASGPAATSESPRPEASLTVPLTAAAAAAAAAPTASATAATVTLAPQAADSTTAAATATAALAGQAANLPPRAGPHGARAKVQNTTSVGASGATGPTPQPTSAPAPPPQAPKAVNCDPPYYFDERGNRAFKQECL
jgi:serine/threonine-protein kinase